MTNIGVDGWLQLGDSGWRRGVDGVAVVRADAGWDVKSANGRVVANLLDPAEARRLADIGRFSPGVPAVYEFNDPAGLPALIEAIRHLHGLEATWLESVPVVETHEGQTVWAGEVQVFAVEHPKASRVYAWSHETDTGKRRFHAVLGIPPVTGAQAALRIAVLSEASR